MGIREHVGVSEARDKGKQNRISLKDILRTNFSLINWYSQSVRWTIGAGFTRTDLHHPGPHRDATIYKGKNFLSARPLMVELTEVLNIPWVG
jgi:hypothetical protein